MNYLKILLFIPIHAFFLLNLFGQSDFMAGAAKINITPDIPIRMSGYANRSEPFTGVHDSIYATALAFENGQTRMVMVAADVIGFSHEFVDQTKTRIKNATGVTEDQVLIVAAHNHGGPVTSVYTGSSTDAEEAYYEELKNKLALLTKKAFENIQPAKIGAGKGICQMNVNRRARHAEGGIWLGRNPAGPCDHEVAIIRIDDLQDNPIAAYMNWPCHATVSGQENTMITGDWPGAAARSFTLQTNILVMVTAGASADINPIYGPNAKFNDIAAIGHVLGEEAVRIFENIETHSPSEIQMIQAVFMAPGKKRSESRMAPVSLEESENQMIRIAVCKIGSILLAGISGELMTEIGMEIKEQSPYKNTFIVTHCNGSNGYLCTDKAYEEGGYEPMVSKTMPGTEKAIRENIVLLLQRM